MKRCSVMLAVVGALIVMTGSLEAQTSRTTTAKPETDAMITGWMKDFIEHPERSQSWVWNQIPADRAVAKLRPFLFDGDNQLRVGAAERIGSLKARPVAGALALAAALDSAPDIDTKVAIADALSEYEAAGAPGVSALVRALKAAVAENPHSTNEGGKFLNALAYIGPSAAGSLGPVLELVHDSATAVFLLSGTRDYGMFYFNAMGSGLAKYRFTILREMTLGRIRPDTLLAKSLAKSGGVVFDTLVAALGVQPRANGADGTQFIGLLYTLGFTQNPKAVPILVRYATAPDNGSYWLWSQLREAAVYALGYLGTAGAAAIPDLQELSQPGSMVSDIAKLSIRRIRTAQLTRQ